jgi:TolB-like protein
MSRYFWSASTNCPPVMLTSFQTISSINYGNTKEQSARSLGMDFMTCASSLRQLQQVASNSLLVQTQVGKSHHSTL